MPAGRDDSNDHFSAASSRMPAVFVREQALKLHQVSHLKRPTDLIPILRIQFSKAEAKLSKGKDDKEGKGKEEQEEEEGTFRKETVLTRAEGTTVMALRFSVPVCGASFFPSPNSRTDSPECKPRSSKSPERSAKKRHSPEYQTRSSRSKEFRVFAASAVCFFAASSSRPTTSQDFCSMWLSASCVWRSKTFSCQVPLKPAPLA